MKYNIHLAEIETYEKLKRLAKPTKAIQDTNINYKYSVHVVKYPK